MDSQRNLLVIALLFVSFMIWQTWQTDHNPQPATVQTTQQTASAATGDAVNQGIPASGQGQLINVKTDVLSLSINTRGGDVDQAHLLTYPDKLGSDQPFHLLETSPDFVYQAQSGLTGKNGPDNQDELRVPLTYTAPDGVVYTKTFVLKRGEYAVSVEYDVRNTSAMPLELALFGQLKQSVDLPKHRDTGSSNFALHTYRGAAYSSSDNKYKKYSFSDIKSEPLNVTTQGGWVAMLQQYFATAWVPGTQGANHFFTTHMH